MPGVVFHVYLFPFSFFGNEDFSPSLLLCSFSSFHPLVLCFSTPSPTWNEISRRMVTKSNCFIWMMHPGIYVLFFKVIVIGFYCVAHLNLFSSHQLYVLFFVYGLALSLHISPASPPWPVPSLSRTCLMWECCNCFWLVSMLHPTLADWLNFIYFFYFMGLLLTLGFVKRPYLAVCNFYVI